MYKKLNSMGTLIQKTIMEAPHETLCTTSDWMFSATASRMRAGRSTVKTLPQPQIMAMEATIFTGWIYDHLLPHAEQVKVAHPLMLWAIAAAKKRRLPTACAATFCQSATWLPPRFGTGAAPCATGTCWCARWCR